jgi:hypothetical protein
MIALIELFCDVDDFLKQFLPQWEKSLLETESVKRRRPFVSRQSHGHCAMVSSLSLSQF